MLAPPRPTAVIDAGACPDASPAAVADRVERAFAGVGVGVDLRVAYTEHTLATVIAQAPGRVVLVGGDAVLHTAINLDAPAEVALVPLGGSTNFARAIGVPAELDAAVSLAVGGTPRPVDVVEVVTPHGAVRAAQGVAAGFAASTERCRAGGRARRLTAVRRVGSHRARFVFDGDGPRKVNFESAFFSVVPGDRGAEADGGREQRGRLALRRHGRYKHLGTMLAAGSAPGGAWWDADLHREVEIVDPVPLMADTRPLGVTTARITVDSATLRVVGPRREAR